MGNTLQGLFAPPTIRIDMFGLDNAGKSIVLQQLKFGRYINDRGTIGFNTETIMFRNISVTLWDMCGQEEVRKNWNHFYKNSSAIIFVVDATDTNRIRLAAEELHKIVAQPNPILNAPILILANKMDLVHALAISEVSQQLELNRITNRKWFLQPSQAINGSGINDGMNWIIDTLTNSAK